MSKELIKIEIERTELEEAVAALDRVLLEGRHWDVRRLYDALLTALAKHSESKITHIQWTERCPDDDGK